MNKIAFQKVTAWGAYSINYDHLCKIYGTVDLNMVKATEVKVENHNKNPKY